MSNPNSVLELLAIIVPVAISAVVAVTTNQQILSLKEKVAERGARIARLEQALMDHGIPLPNDGTVDSRTDGLNMN